jgi:post-segregation antitoxin (ccd killing protein)
LRRGATAEAFLAAYVPAVGTQEEPTANLKLLQEARRLGVDVQKIVKEARQRRWENRGAIADANAFVDRHGLWSDGRRQF